jgi:small subunit ribosomal protein S6
VNDVRDYELVYILDPDLSEEAVTGLMDRFKNLASSQGAEIRSQERWEKRRLAYEIKDKREGIYVVMELNASPDAAHEMERILKITDGVLRHLIVRVEEGKTTKVTDLPREERPAAPAVPEAASSNGAASEEPAPAETASPEPGETGEEAAPEPEAETPQPAEVAEEAVPAPA